MKLEPSRIYFSRVTPEFLQELKNICYHGKGEPINPLIYGNLILDRIFMFDLEYDIDLGEASVMIAGI